MTFLSLMHQTESELFDFEYFLYDLIFSVNLLFFIFYTNVSLFFFSQQSLGSLTNSFTFSSFAIAENDVADYKRLNKRRCLYSND